MEGMPNQQKPFGRRGRWLRGLLTAFLYTLVGTLLAVFPWLPGWDQNYFSGSRPDWYAVWMNPYFRGAITGIGVLNLLASFEELVELMRSHRH